MRPDIKTFRVNNRYLIGASLEMRVIVLEPNTYSVVNDVNLQADCMDCFSLSADGGLLAVGLAFERLCCVEVVDLRLNPIVTAESRESATILRLERTHALNVRIAPEGNVVFYWKHSPKAGTYAAHVPTRERQRIVKAASPTNGAWLPDNVILPCEHGKGGVRVSYWPITVNSMVVPSRENIWRITEHPNQEVVALLDANHYVSSLRAESLQLLWQRCIPLSDWITYSGDGSVIAVRQQDSPGGRIVRIVVLDASSGDIVRTVEIRDPADQALYPLDGPRFLCYSGRFLNAESGEFEEGVSSSGFWDKLLKCRN